MYFSLLLNLSLLVEMAQMVGCIIVKRNIEIYTKVAITGEHEIALSTQYLNKIVISKMIKNIITRYYLLTTYLRAICAVVLLYFLENSTNTGLSKKVGIPALLPGCPSGEYPVIVILCFWQNCINGF